MCLWHSSKHKLPIKSKQSVLSASWIRSVGFELEPIEPIPIRNVHDLCDREVV